MRGNSVSEYGFAGAVCYSSQVPADDRLFDIIRAGDSVVIALGPASFNSSDRCEVVSIVVDRGEFVAWIVVDWCQLKTTR